MLRIISSLAFALLIAVPVSATPFTWLIAGTFDSIRDENAGSLAGRFVVGQAYTLRLDMESSALDLDPRPGCGHYATIEKVSLSSGSVSVSHDGGGEYLVNPSGSGAACGMPDGLLRIRTSFAVAGRPETYFALQLHLFAAFATDALPTDPRNIGFSIFELTSVASNPFTFAHSNPTTVTAVPEPITASLLLAGGLLSALRVRRRRQPSVRRGSCERKRRPATAPTSRVDPGTLPWTC